MVLKAKIFTLGERYSCREITLVANSGISTLGFKWITVTFPPQRNNEETSKCDTQRGMPTYAPGDKSCYVRGMNTEELGDM